MLPPVTSSKWHLHCIFQKDKVGIANMLEAAVSEISRNDGYLAVGENWNKTHFPSKALSLFWTVTTLHTDKGPKQADTS